MIFIATSEMLYYNPNFSLGENKASAQKKQTFFSALSLCLYFISFLSLLRLTLLLTFALSEYLN